MTWLFANTRQPVMYPLSIARGLGSMTMFLKSVGLVFALLAAIAVLIVIPAWQFGVVTDWKVILLAIGYFAFFLGTVWRAG
jgi:hypothetical protein